MRKTYQYRIYPTHNQTTRLNAALNECRWLYNHFLEMRKNSYEQEGKSLSCYGQSVTLPLLKRERESLSTIYAQVLQNVSVRVDLAFKAFFRRIKTGKTPGYPRFRGQDRYDSFTYPQNGFKIDPEGKLYASGIGHIKIGLHRALVGKIKTLTLKRSSTGKWYATFSLELDRMPLPANAKSVGVDVGLKTFASFSDATEIKNPRFFHKEEKALAKVQRKHAKLEKGAPERRVHRRVARVEKQTLDGILFYYMDDIEEELSPKEFQEFTSWFSGQTGIIGPYGLGVYLWDWEKFLHRRERRPRVRTGNPLLDEMINAELDLGD